MDSRWFESIIAAPLAVDLVVRMTILLALGWLVHLALWRANPRWRMLLWRTVTVGLLALPAVVLLLPAIEIEVQMPETRRGAAPVETNAAADWNGGVGFSAAENDRQVPQSGATGRLTGLLGEGKNRAVRVGTTVWLGILAWLAIRFWVGSRLAAHLTRKSRPAPDEIVETCRRVAAILNSPSPVSVRVTAELSTPLLTGLRRPVLLLPAQVCGSSYRAELPGIIAHELAHLRTNDLFWSCLVHWLAIVLWFHPLAWRIRGAHAAACEQASDAVSAHFVGSVGRYSRTLARVAVELVACPPVMSGIPMARVSEIQRRLERLKRRVFFAPLQRRYAVAACLGALLAVGGLGALRLAYAAETPEATGDVTEPATTAQTGLPDVATDEEPEPKKEPVDLNQLAGLDTQLSSSWPQVLRVSLAQGTTKTRTLDIWSWNGGLMEYEIATDPSALLEIVPASGRTRGEVNTHAVHFKTANLPPGVHNASITINANAPNSPVTIPVEITVTPATSIPMPAGW